MLKDYRVVLGLSGLVAVFMLANLGLAMQRGALAMAPIYDDNTYLLDGINRVVFENVDSLLSMIVSFYHNPPHSPFSTMLAMAGYSLSGGSDIGPYAMNFIGLAVYAVGIYVITAERTGKFLGILCTAALMFVPAVGTLVTEFRPDAFAGLSFGLAAYWLVFFRYDQSSKRAACALGALAAAVTAIKPSAVIIVVPMLGFAFLLGAAKSRSLRSVRLMAWTLGAGLLVVMPFALIWGAHVAAYIHQVFFTNADVWVTPGSAAFHWAYNAFGAAGSRALGMFFFIGAFLIAVDLLTLRMNSKENFPTAAFYLWVAIIYVGIAVNPQKSAYQGNFFYFPFIIATGLAAARLIERTRMPRSALLAVTAGIAIISPPAMTYQDARQRPGSLQALEQIGSILNNSMSCKSLSFAAVGPYPIPPETIALRAAKQGVKLQIHTLFLIREEADFTTLALSSTFVSFPNSAGRAEAEAQRLPGLQHLPRLMAMLDSSQDWERYDITGADPSVIYRNKMLCDGRGANKP
ncbi:glycosyltransferase family 39 protein [Rhizobium sp. FY34]|uniref:ArnT family glycosyltransferase n=1 Tax=Rhizobium sp. FY34 TaxID=2562309 RepID=UPI0010C13673|nr:glycosyltransferase family 39 protein [Rhizobium sp. FY34]